MIPNSTMKVVLVCGARPNFMKVARLMRAIVEHNISAKKNRIVPVLVHTGQHYNYEMSKIFFEDLELPEPEFHLAIGSGTHAEQTGRVMIAFEQVLHKEQPDLVIVVGDVNSTLAAAIVASKLHIKVGHVEAGLRSYDKNMPEEINRLLTDHVSSYLFTPSHDADENLKREGITEDKIFFVGNIMIDSLLSHKEIASQRQILSQLGLEKEGYALLTLHRPDNVDERGNLLKIIKASREISQRIPIVFPTHPRTHKRMEEFDLLNQLPLHNRRLLVTEPLGYLDFLNLEMNSKFVMTDSGGIQTESTILSVPCLTLYHATCWIDTITEGTNTLVNVETSKIIAEAFKILDGKGKKGSCPELWDGKTAERIVRVLTSHTNL
ncbi:non-hydrolyzing UDP-N-acetylglucosamine 2-epimerase [Chloroflexota bacterium]